jgi:hypothetical protein
MKPRKFYLVTGVMYAAPMTEPLAWWSPLHGWDNDMDNAVRYDTFEAACDGLERAQRDKDAWHQVVSAAIQEIIE